MNLLWAFVILVVADALAIAALLWVRRGAPEGNWFADADRASGVFGVLATGFAIFAGFVVFLAFTSYDESRSGAEAEALTVVQQFETAQSLPAAIRSRMPGELVCYGRSVAGLPGVAARGAGERGRHDQPLEPCAVQEHAACHGTFAAAARSGAGGADDTDLLPCDAQGAAT